MKRLMLATTAAIALSGPVAAQTSADALVESELMTMGYDAATIDMLSEAQVTELYIAMTSDDETAVMNLLRGYEATQSDGPAGLTDTARADDTRAIVVQALAENGMAPGIADILSDGEYTELFLAASGDDQTAVERVISGFDFGPNDDGAMEIAASSAERRVMTALEARGFTSAELEQIDSEEVSEIFLALVSGNELDISNAIDSALGS